VRNPAEGDEDGEAQRVHTGSEGAGGPGAHDVANITGTDGERDHQRRVRVSYDAVTDAYVERVHGELAHKPLDRAVLAAFAEQVLDAFDGAASVCDAGCGPGHIGAFLADRGLTVTGIDLSPAMIERARELHPDLTFEVGTMTALEAGNEHWQGLIAFYSLIHLTSDEELRAALGEFHRTLVDGGLLLVAVHLGEHGDATVHADDMLGVSVDMDFHFFAADQLAAEITSAGFNIVAQLIRAPYPDVEVQTTRAYVLARRIDAG
jgi:SAM-dependent methyltransferase